jgi:hypothetical protein
MFFKTLLKRTRKMLFNIRARQFSGIRPVLQHLADASYLKSDLTALLIGK